MCIKNFASKLCFTVFFFLYILWVERVWAGYEISRWSEKRPVCTSNVASITNVLPYISWKKRLAFCIYLFYFYLFILVFFSTARAVFVAFWESVWINFNVFKLELIFEMEWDFYRIRINISNVMSMEILFGFSNVLFVLLEDNIVDSERLVLQ